MKKFLIYTFVLFILLTPTVFIFGQTQGGGTQGGSSGNSTTFIRIENPLKVGNTLPEVLVALLRNVVMPIAAVAAVVYIVLAGFKYVTARGNPAKIQSAHQNLLWALVGAGILLGAAGISEVVQRTVSELIN